MRDQAQGLFVRSTLRFDVHRDEMPSDIDESSGDDDDSMGALCSTRKRSGSKASLDADHKKVNAPSWCGLNFDGFFQKRQKKTVPIVAADAGALLKPAKFIPKGTSWAGPDWRQFFGQKEPGLDGDSPRAVVSVGPIRKKAIRLPKHKVRQIFRGRTQTPDDKRPEGPVVRRRRLRRPVVRKEDYGGQYLLPRRRPEGMTPRH